MTDEEPSSKRHELLPAVKGEEKALRLATRDAGVQTLKLEAARSLSPEARGGSPAPSAGASEPSAVLQAVAAPARAPRTKGSGTASRLAKTASPRAHQRSTTLRAGATTSPAQHETSVADGPGIFAIDVESPYEDMLKNLAATSPRVKPPGAVVKAQPPAAPKEPEPPTTPQ